MRLKTLKELSDHKLALVDRLGKKHPLVTEYDKIRVSYVQLAKKYMDLVEMFEIQKQLNRKTNGND